MDLARTLAADLRDLALDLSADGYASTTLDMIEHGLRRSVPSTLGASIALRTPAAPEVPVVVNLVSRTIGADEVKAALALPLPTVDRRRTAVITFYAAQPDAFSRLLPDLVDLLHLDPATVEQHAALPSGPIVPRIGGLQDFSLVNRALGVLLNRGHTLDSARSEIALQAEQAGVDLVATARALLGSTDR